MGKLAFLYPGQGSQRVGMGRDILERLPELFENYLVRCDACTDMTVTQYCLVGPRESLSETHVAQPAVFAHSLALTDYARSRGLVPDFVAGHSLGEYTAAVAAGFLSFHDGLRLVAERGKLMYHLQRGAPGAMAAVIGLSLEDVQSICDEIEEVIVVANWNTYTQIAISGTEAGVQLARQHITQCTHARVISLPVNGAFHSPLMAPAQSALNTIMPQLSWHDASIPLVSCTTGSILVDRQEVCQALLEQITGLVRWVRCVEVLLQAGCDNFVELGSAQVLTKLVRQIAPNVQAYAVDTLGKIDAYI